MQEKSEYLVRSRKNTPNGHPKRNFVREHVLIAEQKLGRQLKKEETVHHIDGNKKNNNPDNLMVFATNSDHTTYHHTGKAYEKDGVWHALHDKVTCTCAYCGKQFERTPSQVSTQYVYCCRDCFNKAKAINLTDKFRKELFNLLKSEKGNFSKIGKQFNVSDNAVRKWCKKMNIPTHSSDYK